LRVLLLTVGTRGDVQPFMALAAGLQAAGHSVAICTCPRFSSVITAAGIGFLPLDEGLLQLLDSQLGREVISSLSGVLRALNAIPRVVRQLRPIHDRMLADAWSAAELFQPDMLVFHPKLFSVPAFAARLKIPAVMALLCPMLVPTGETPFWGLPQLPLGRTYNRSTYHLIQSLSHFGTRAYVRRWRTAHDPAGLSRGSTLSRFAPGVPVPVMHAYSPSVCPPPGDWPAHASVTGYWFLPDTADSPSSWQPSPELQAFLSQGPPPVYIGFGSMAGANPARTTSILLEAVKLSGVRAILATGWGGIQAHAETGAVHLIDAVPHEWLFPRVSAVVHHGGAGTTAAGLRAGRPTLVCPFGLDQPFWGQRVHALGCGPRPVHQRRLNSHQLAEALRQLSRDPQFLQAAERVGAAIRSEAGVASAVHLLEQAFHTARSER
jgi:sterol 3beta-glucosyltransferase